MVLQPCEQMGDALSKEFALGEIAFGEIIKAMPGTIIANAEADIAALEYEAEQETEDGNERSSSDE